MAAWGYEFYLRVLKVCVCPLNVHGMVLVCAGVMDVSNAALSSSAVLLLAELHVHEAEHHG